jgi:hypothetical protein
MGRLDAPSYAKMFLVTLAQQKRATEGFAPIRCDTKATRNREQYTRSLANSEKPSTTQSVE